MHRSTTIGHGEYQEGQPLNQCMHVCVSDVWSSVTTTHLKARFPFHSNARKALRKEKYASKIKNAQETQQIQENYASKKQKYASASHTIDASCPYARKRNDRIDSIFHASHATRALALRAFEWKPGLSKHSNPHYTDMSSVPATTSSRSN